MFVSQSHQPQVLPAEAYYSPEQHRLEMERLFAPGWHCVGTTAEIPAEGDYITLDLLGRPLIVWRREGAIHVFLNVCAHRYTQLTSCPRGQMPTLRCQYHGWEYGSDGATRTIPDARSFRPLAREMAALTKLRSQTCGQLIFVTLADDAPPLEEYLGPGYPLAAEVFSHAWRPTLALEQPVEANWKLLLENVLENYHLVAVHGRTFKAFPPEEICHHELAPHWTLYRERSDGRHSHLSGMARAVAWLVGVEAEIGIDHLHCYPNLVVAKMGLHSWVQVVLPDGPTRARSRWRFFHYAGTAGGSRARLGAWLLRSWGQRFFRQVLEEDGRLLPDVQRGLSAATLPRGGLISTREERIVHFQSYVARSLGVSPTSPMSLALPASAAPADAAVACDCTAPAAATVARDCMTPADAAVACDDSEPDDAAVQRESRGQVNPSIHYRSTPR